MHPLDILINANKSPKEGMEYVYLLDMVWKPNKFGSLPLKFGSIVNNVVKLENDGFEFTDKETGEKYRTNYGWALAENTLENAVFINDWMESNAKLKKLERETKKLRNKIIDLDGSSKLK